MKRIFILITCAALLVACKKEEEQFENYNVRVLDAWTGEGVPNSTIYAQENRGSYFNFDVFSVPMDGNGFVQMNRTETLGLFLTATSADRDIHFPEIEGGLY